MRIPILIMFFLLPLPQISNSSGSIPEGTVLAQVVQGGEYSTELQVVNTDDESRPIPYTISFFKNGGLPMFVRVLDHNGNDTGTKSIIAGVVNYPGVDFYTLPSGGTQSAGYAVIEASDFRAVMVNSVLTRHVPGIPDFQASVPSLNYGIDLARFPFKNSRSYITTLAIASTFSNSNLTVIARDRNGVELCRNNLELEEGAHIAVYLSQFLPCTDGIDGLIELADDRFGVTAIAFLFNPYGAFTTQLPFEICCIF